mmetsp:Transcript_15904/g.22138  ORF Transcript_15904/g.22138 Transcript_15904/m.22138 type:complete len:104 (-) Transcript_15904:80-391(-)
MKREQSIREKDSYQILVEASSPKQSRTETVSVSISHLRCQYSNEILKHPVVLVPCGHSIEKRLVSCKQRTHCERPKCPVCKKPFERYVTNAGHHTWSCDRPFP